MTLITFASPPAPRNWLGLQCSHVQAVLGANPLRFRIDNAAIVLGRVKAEPDGGR
jgi:hypothetical protein